MKRAAVLIFMAAVLFVLTISGCGPAPNPTLTITAPPPTTFPSPTVPPTATLPPGQEPIEISSFIHPTSFTNPPAGPIVEITLKNVYDEPVIYLKASLDLNIPIPLNPYLFHFDVSALKSLLPGGTISSRQTLFRGGYGNNILYPVTINGTLQSNVAFIYTKEVFITESP
jgi:hypothetical protein